MGSSRSLSRFFADRCSVNFKDSFFTQEYYQNLDASKASIVLSSLFKPDSNLGRQLDLHIKSSYGDTKQGFPESRLCKASSTVIAHQLVMLGHLFLVTSFGLDFILGCDSLQATFLSDILSSNAQGSYILIEKPVN
ncbi:hypothetical protein F8388_000395 [Cannabis sativa]|uniref:Uncharacterized protein n=1 Tax=Cannabis sativa TaxID=3483 RepID=A0A7J6E0J4_CANSA|nr:hypothetical protein F8388_000395 [Cannabis sativa]